MRDIHVAQYDVHGPDGALWLPLPMPKAATHFAGDPKDFEVARDLGWARFADLDGNVWFAAEELSRVKQLSVWRNGEVVRQLPVSGAGESFKLFTDRRGSVWAWTDAGLHHWILRNPTKPGEYDLEAVYPLTAEVGFVSGVQYSPLGFVVLNTVGDKMGRTRKLHIVRLPTPAPPAK